MTYKLTAFMQELETFVPSSSSLSRLLQSFYLTSHIFTYVNLITFLRIQTLYSRNRANQSHLCFLSQFNKELLYLYTMSELLTRGMIAETYLTGNNTVIKVPKIDDDDDGITQANRKATRNEASIYTLLGNHPNIAKCVYISPSKQHIELEYYQNGTLKDYVNEHRKRITDKHLTRWARQIIESINFIHLKGVRHSDLRLDQWLLHIDLNARLSDFNGSGYDSNLALALEGSESINLERASHFMPRDPMDDSTVKSDLFALGSVLYELVVGQYPYESLDDMTIEALYRQGSFPSVQGLFLGKVILRCWTARFQSASDILIYGQTQYGL